MIEVLETVGEQGRLPLGDRCRAVPSGTHGGTSTTERASASTQAASATGVFLDGTIEPAPPSFLMTKSGSGWSVDAGEVHGLRAPADGEEFRFACLQPDGTPCGQVRVVAVESGQSLGGADGLGAGRHRVPSGDLVGAAADGNRHVRRRRWRAAAAAYEQVRQVLASSGPAGTPSPYVRERTRRCIGRARPARQVRGRQPDGPCLRVLRADGSPAIPGAASAVACGDPTPRRADPRSAAGTRGPVGAAPRARQPSLGPRRRGAAEDLPSRAGEAALPPDRDPFGLAGEYTIPYGAERRGAERLHASEEHVGPRSPRRAARSDRPLGVRRPLSDDRRSPRAWRTT